MIMRRGVARRTTRRTARRVFRRRLIVGGAALFIVGGIAHKMSQSDTQRVEQQAGKPVEEMNEQELQAAMQKAGVQEQQVTAEDERAMEAAGEEEEMPTR